MKTIIVALLLVTHTAHADTANDISLGAFDRAMHSASANAITGDSLTGASIGYARLLPLELVPKLQLWAAGNLLGGTVRDEMFQTLDTELHILQFSAGARARYPLFHRLVWATAKVDAGAQRARLTLEDMAGHEASDVGWGAMTTTALGIDITPLAASWIGLGFRLELGYVAASSIGIDARSDGPPDDTNELDRMAASLGGLDVSGRYASFVIVGLF